MNDHQLAKKSITDDYRGNQYVNEYCKKYLQHISNAHATTETNTLNGLYGVKIKLS